MAKTPFRSSRLRAFTSLALASGALIAPVAAWADCTADATGTVITCSGSSAAYTYTPPAATPTAPATVSVASGATVTAPLIAAIAGSTLTNAGTISNAAAAAGVQMGDGVAGSTTPTVLNSGTITSTSASGSAIAVGNNATVENAGALTAVAGTAAARFGANGTFKNDAAATAAITGNIVFGTSITADTATFINNNTAFGLTGNVIATGRITATNAGIFTGNFSQGIVSGQDAVTFTNTSAGTFTGIVAIEANANVSNAGTMYLTAGSTLGSAFSGGGGSSVLTNTGTLYIGTATVPAQVNVYGNFVQTGGTSNFVILPGSAAAGTTYSQIALSGTAALAGKITLNVQPGFYVSGTKFDIITAKGGITNNGVTASTGTALPFVTFTNNGIVNLASGGQAYEFVAQHTSDYAAALTAALAGTATPAAANELAVASALNPLVATASASASSDAATLLGYLDVLTAAQAQTFLDSLSPEGYLAYASALRDQANTFARQVDLRMTDHNSGEVQDGWWGSLMGQFQIGGSKSSAPGSLTSKANLFGFNLGYDWSGPAYVLGAAASLSWNSEKAANTYLTGKNRDIALALYGAKSLGTLRISGQVAYNFGHLSATKTIDLTNTTRTYNASAGEYMLKVTAQVGLDLHAGGWLLEPFAGIDYNKGQINAFTESGGLSADLTVARIKADHTDLLGGLNLTRDHGTFRPYVKAMYRERLSGSALDLVSASLSGNTGDVPFTVAGLGVGKGELDAHAGVNWVFDDAGSLFVGYQGTIRSHFNSHGINLGMRIEF